MFKTKKTKLPNKKTMNLYQPVHQDDPKAVLTYGVGACVILAILLLIFVLIPKYQEINQQKLLNADLTDKSTRYHAEMSNYNQVKEDYYRYSDIIHDGGIKLVDRLEIINIVNTAINELGTVPAISVSDNIIAINLSSTNTALLADVIERLESNPYVTKVQVFNSNKSETEVVSVMTIYVAEVEE